MLRAVSAVNVLGGTGTISGRMRFSQPAIQQIPHSPRV
jgi:hypothetical protein